LGLGGLWVFGIGGSKEGSTADATGVEREVVCFGDERKKDEREALSKL